MRYNIVYLFCFYMMFGKYGFDMVYPVLDDVFL